MTDPYDDLPGSLPPRVERMAQDSGADFPGSDWRRNFKPRTYSVRGQPVPFYTVSALAFALNKSLATVRAWERAGVLPSNKRRSPKGDSHMPGHRLYAASEIDRLRSIAISEGIVPHERGAVPENRFIEQTQFRERAQGVFPS